MDCVAWAVLIFLAGLFLMILWSMLAIGAPTDLDEEERCLKADEERRRRKKRCKEVKS